MKPKFVAFTASDDSKTYINIYAITGFSPVDNDKDLSQILFSYANTAYVKETVEEIRNLLASYDLV